MKGASDIVKEKKNEKMNRLLRKEKEINNALEVNCTFFAKYVTCRFLSGNHLFSFSSRR